MATADRWYDDVRLTVGLTNALIEAGYLEDNSEIQEFLQELRKKPQKFNDEFDAWQEAGYPDDEGEDGWTDFTNAISSEEGS